MDAIESAQMNQEKLEDLYDLFDEEIENLRKMHDEKTQLFESMQAPIITNLRAIRRQKIYLLLTTFAFLALQLLTLSGLVTQYLLLSTAGSILLAFALTLMTYSQLYHKEQHLKQLIRRQQELFNF